MRRFFIYPSVQPLLFLVGLFFVGLFGEFIHDGSFDWSQMEDGYWGFGSATVLGIVLIWSRYNFSKGWKKSVVTIGVPFFLLIFLLDFRFGYSQSLGLVDDFFTVGGFIGAMILTAWVSSDFRFFAWDEAFVETPEIKLSDLHEGNVAALIQYSLEQAERLRRTAYATLAAVGVLIAISVLAVLFAGLITQLDLRSTDALAVAQREYDDLVTQQQTALTESTLAEEAYKERLNELSKAQNDPQTASPSDGLFSESTADLRAKSEVARQTYDRISKNLDDASARLSNMKSKQADQAIGATDLSEQNSQSLIASAVTRFGVAALLLFFAQALVNLYRYTLRLSTFYHSRAMILSYSNGRIDKIERITPHLSADTVPFGKDVQTPIEQVVKVAEVLKK